MLKLYFTNFKRLFRKFLVSSRNWILVRNCLNFDSPLTNAYDIV